MKFLAIRAMAFGVTCSAFAGRVLAGLAKLASSPYVPDLLGWPFLVFVFGGFPLSALLELLPGFERLQWAIFPVGGPAAAFASLLSASLITWTDVVALGRLLWLSKRRAGPNNSFKPKPLRGWA